MEDDITTTVSTCAA